MYPRLFFLDRSRVLLKHQLEHETLKRSRMIQLLLLNYSCILESDQNILLEWIQVKRIKQTARYTLRLMLTYVLS